jgi:hypothetical protein
MIEHMEKTGKIEKTGDYNIYRIGSHLSQRKKKNGAICDNDFKLGYRNIIQFSRVDGDNSSNLGISSVYVGIS